MKGVAGAIVPAGTGLAAVLATIAVSAGRPVAVSCSEAIYTTRANVPPKPVRAVRIGFAVFDSLAGLTTLRSLDKPSKRLPFYTAKVPLTILARADRGVVITLTDGEKDAALLYNRVWLKRLTGRWRYRFRDVPRSVGLALCRESNTGLPLNTQYAGGFLLRKPGCLTIRVQRIGETTAHQATVPVGVRHC
jgi:hypothetical protein